MFQTIQVHSCNVSIIDNIPEALLISIKRISRAPSYDNGYMAGLNAVDKQYLEKLIMLIELLYEENCNIKN